MGKNKGHVMISKTIYLGLNPTPEAVSKALKDMFKDIYDTLNGQKMIYMLAHNAGRFDLKVLMNPLMKLINNMDFRVEYVISDSGGDIYQLNLETMNCKFALRDSYKLIPASAKNIANMFLHTRYKLEVVHDILNRYLVSPDADITTWNPTLESAFPGAKDEFATPLMFLEKYCMIDCEIIANAIIKFRTRMKNTLDINIPAKSMMTISSASINLFLKKFNDIREPIIIMNVQTPLSG